jgi:hypothetical protein
MKLTASAHRRRGVVLIAVLGLLALLALVGVTFAFQGDVARPGNQEFREEVGNLGSDTRDLAFSLGRDLAAMDDDEGAVLSAYPDALRRLSERAADIQVRVRQAHDRSDDPAIRADLRVLDRRLERYQDRLCLLREIIELIIRGS